MGITLIEIGCDGGSIRISRECVHEVFLFHVQGSEIFTDNEFRTVTFLSLDDAWSFLKEIYKYWYQLYLVQISTQVAELIKKDYIMAPDKNEHTIDSWLIQLTGRGIGF